MCVDVGLLAVPGPAAQFGKVPTHHPAPQITDPTAAVRVSPLAGIRESASPALESPERWVSAR
jgi:hypothetical protein